MRAVPFDPLNMPCRSNQPGVTLLELAIVIAIVAILSATGFLVLGQLNEDEDGALVQSVQSSLSNIIPQAADRLNVAPNAVPLTRVLNVMPANPLITLTASSGTELNLSVKKTGRSALYRVNPCGQVCVETLGGFTKFSLVANDQRCQTDPSPCRTPRHN